MDKNKILAAAQNNKERGNEYETKKTVKSLLYGLVSILFMSALFILIEYYTTKKVSMSLIALNTTEWSACSLSFGIHSRKVLPIIFGCICSLVTLILIITMVV